MQLWRRNASFCCCFKDLWMKRTWRSTRIIITINHSLLFLTTLPIYIYIYIHNRISHNIIAVHMYGILFCIPIIYLIFAQILQFTRIWSIYPDIVLTCFNHITHTLSIYIYSEDPIYSRSRRERRERREPLTGEAPAQRHASLGPSLCASSQVPDGQGCLSRFIAVVGWFHGILWKFMVI